MYKFIKGCVKECLVNEEQIREIEEIWNISFPEILKDYYQNYNGCKINLCVFFMDGFEYEISEILPLKYGSFTFDDVIANDRGDGIIPSNMIPIAHNRGGDIYYWDTLNENIVLYYSDDIENPIYICDNVKTLFEIMESNCF